LQPSPLALNAHAEQQNETQPLEKPGKSRPLGSRVSDGGTSLTCGRAADKTLKYKEMKEEVVEYLHSRGVSQSLVSNVLRFYDMRYPNKVYFEEDRILNGLPKGLIDRIKLQCYSEVLANTGTP